MLIVDKPLGWTPNQLINTIKKKHPEYEKFKDVICRAFRSNGERINAYFVRRRV